LFAVGGVVVILVLALAASRVTRPDVLPNLTLAGQVVGGMSRAELQSAVTTLRTNRNSDMVTAQLENNRRRATNAAIGYDIDVEATVHAVWRRGRQANLLAALADHVRASFGAITVDPVTSLDDAKVDRWVAGTVAALEIPPVEGNVRFVGTDVRRRDPRPGSRPDAETVRSGTLAALADPGPSTVEFETEAVEPRTSREDVDRLAEQAERVVSAPVELSRNRETLTLEPETLAGLHAVEQAPRDSKHPFRLIIPKRSLAEVFTDEVRERFEIEPRDAAVVLTAGGPKVRNGRNGFALDLDATRAQIQELARTETQGGASRTGKLEGKVLEPERTTEQARELNVTQRVSSFTTEHSCCETRVTNIHRFAELMDGVLIEPDETFSLNGHVGQRTAANGFVTGGAIQQGEYVEEVGGGVSQFATTFFNAAFFGGYEIVEHKPHSYYISRYPPGRESTINYPNVDVKVRNNSPYGILVDTSYTGTSITVTFWGKKWVDVQSSTGEPHNHTSPETEIRQNPDLPPGTEQIVQAGSNGFDILVTRRLRYDDGSADTEEYFTRYLAEPRIIERGPRKK
jgi:vancomycin resistance protein YoaR